MLKRLAAIGVAGVLLGLLLNGVHPRGVALTTPVFAASESGTGECSAVAALVGDIALAPAAILCADCTAAFVDARSAREYESGHIAGAVHLPPADHPDSDATLNTLFEASTLVVYGDNTECNLARSVAERLVSVGHPDVRVLQGGWPAWSEDSQPSVSGACVACESSAVPHSPHD